MKSRLVFWLVAVVLGLTQLPDYRWQAQKVLDGPGGGYYGYLPGYFLPGGDSLSQLRAQPGGQPRPLSYLGARRLPTGKGPGKYPLGVAPGQLPWLAGAHLYARWHGDPPNGRSRPYQQAGLVAGLAYALIGLWVLRKLLRRYVPDHVAAWTLGAIALGTNLLAYATHEAARPPATLFMWQAALLYCTARWYESPRRGWAAGMGLFWGLAVLGRPAEAVYALVPLCWGLGAGRRPAVLGRYLDQLLLAGGTAAAVLSLQFFYWHAVGGPGVAGSYQPELFDLRRPHFIEGLFSFRQGWLLYTPLMGLALLGAGWLRRWVPGALAPVLGLLPVLLGLTFGGQPGGYGGGFGAGPLISAYPLLALPLAALLATAAPRGGLAWAGLRTLLVAGIALTMWQTWQWHGGIIEPENETRALYLQRFFWRQLP